MSATVVEVSSRGILQGQPDHDFQPWRGIAGEGKQLRFWNVRTSAKRCVCSISEPQNFVRWTQGGQSGFNSHFADFGEVVIASNANGGGPFSVAFDPPVSALGLDLEAVPAGITPGQKYRVELDVVDSDGSHHMFEKLGTVQSAVFLGIEADAEAIAALTARAFLLEGGAQTPVDFCLNRIDLRIVGPIS
ncbi:MAG: hypothetical protein R3F54_16460 [Alphaproteobacteria bacterium]